MSEYKHAVCAHRDKDIKYVNIFAFFLFLSFYESFVCMLVYMCISMHVRELMCMPIIIMCVKVEVISDNG